MAWGQQFLPVPVSPSSSTPGWSTGSTPRLALDLGRCGLKPMKLAKVYLAGALHPRHGQRAAALAGQPAPGVVQVPLQQRKLADEGLQRGLGVVKQHDADGGMRICVVARGMRLTTKVPPCW